MNSHSYSYDNADIRLKNFTELTAEELYDICTLRQIVFVVEQNCAYLDNDGHDKAARHLGLYSNGRLCAYSRILPPNEKYPEPSIGRVVSHPDYRRKGFGRDIVAHAIQTCETLFPEQSIRISAQKYLERFYASFGFVSTGFEYDEDGIPHCEMLRVSTQPPH